MRPGERDMAAQTEAEPDADIYVDEGGDIQEDLSNQPINDDDD